MPRLVAGFPACQGSAGIFMREKIAGDPGRKGASLRRLTDADESAPQGGEAGPDQYVNRMAAESIAVSTHGASDAAELALVGRVKQAGQNDKKTGDNVHGEPFGCFAHLRRRRLRSARTAILADRASAGPGE